MKRNFFACVVLISSSVLAGGFRLDGQDAQAMGMGNAVTASASGASAVYFNPAGLSGVKGFDALVGVSLILPKVSFTSIASGATTSTKSSVSNPINAYVSYGITDDLAVAVGFYTPFGASAQWPAGWEGSSKSLTSNVQTFDINPAVSYRVLPRLKLGAGLQITRGTVFLERGLDFLDSQGKVQVGGDAWGLGWTAGIQGEVVEKRLFLGASWKSAVPLAFKGRAHFVDVLESFQSRLADQPASADVTLPHVGAVGVSFSPIDSLRFGLDANFVTWSSFQKLEIKFEKGELTNPLPKKWTNQVSVHAGAEYKVNDAFAVRLGAIYDPTGSPQDTVTPDLPDATRVRVAVGAGWKSDFGLRADFAYQLVVLLSQPSTAPGIAGTYSGMAHVFALNVGFKM